MNVRNLADEVALAQEALPPTVSGLCVTLTDQDCESMSRKLPQYGSENEKF